MNSSGTSRSAPSSITARWSAPALKYTSTIRPSARNVKYDSPNTHIGPPTSASSAVTAVPSSRYRFHQPVRSDE